MKTLVVITGPTASGKTALAIEVARRLKCDIISADSRQIFRGMPIGTAAPSAGELAVVRHHFVGTLDITDYYSAARYESDVMELLPRLFAEGDFAVMCGGSMMYVDAVCHGIDALPTISEKVRADALALWHEKGTQGVIDRLKELDPEYLRTADLCNHRRLVHALEICLESGAPCSSLRTGTRKERPFHVMKFAIDMPRDMLFARINARTDAMIAAGLPSEAQSLLSKRHLNSLNTVGYKEMFAWIDGVWDLPTATARMAKNTRVYAKKQLTWLKRDPEVRWLDGATLSTSAMADEIIKQISAEHTHYLNR